MFGRIRLLPALAIALLLAGAGYAYTSYRNRLNKPVTMYEEKKEQALNLPAASPQVYDEAIPDQKAQVKKADVKGDFILQIDSIGVKAPINTNVLGTVEKEYLKSLETGVAHYKGTPIPGNPGNAFIFGHSSYYANKPGAYKTIFKELNKVKVGNKLTIKHADQILNYQVTVSKKTSDSDTAVLAESKDEIVTIMTCWPPGTYQDRWVVQAKRI